MEQTALLAPAEKLTTPDLGIDSADIVGIYKFRAEGEAVPQGSFVAFLGKYDKKPRLKPNNEKALKAWRKYVADVAQSQRPDWLRDLWDGPIGMAYLFVRERGDDYLADGTTLKKGARRLPDTAPDGDKLERAINDALTDVVFTNDARITDWAGRKRYAPPGGRAYVDLDVYLLRP
jgi:crossover junction endodeoxyribonuclease RusA